MPTYEYACTACNHRFELVQKFSDAPITECPECAGAVRKVYFAAGVVFKGSGWYINDSRPTQPSESSGAASSSAPASSTASATTTTEAAPSSKSDAPAAPAAAATASTTPSA